MEYINMPYRDLQAVAAKDKVRYVSTPPFPNIYFRDFFNPDMLEEVLKEFPNLSEGQSYKINNDGQVKLATKGTKRFGKATKAFTEYLNSQTFIDFLQELTGIEEPLIADHEFLGGGLHEIKRGGFFRSRVIIVKFDIVAHRVCRPKSMNASSG